MVELPQVMVVDITLAEQVQQHLQTARLQGTQPLKVVDFGIMLVL